jgi:CheY-like chemotaxis protein/HPt (histidine-containing phosphotransfer) domain-containing protein
MRAANPHTPIFMPSCILVIDDHALIRSLLSGILANQGYAVVEAGTGLDGLAMLRNGQVDLALVDLELPDIPGSEMARRWRQDEAANHRSRLPIIAVTGHDEASHREQALAAGMDAMLVKPIVVDLLLATVARHLGNTTRDPSSGMNRAISSQRQPVARSMKAHGTTPLANPILPTRQPISGQVESAKLVDSGAWNTLKASTALTDPTLVRDLLRDLKKQHQAILHEIQEAMDRRDLVALRGVAHRLKGSAATLGLKRLAQTASMLEQDAKYNDLIAAHETFALLRSAFALTLEDPVFTSGIG